MVLFIGLLYFGRISLDAYHASNSAWRTAVVAWGCSVVVQLIICMQDTRKTTGPVGDALKHGHVILKCCLLQLLHFVLPWDGAMRDYPLRRLRAPQHTANAVHGKSVKNGLVAGSTYCPS